MEPLLRQFGGWERRPSLRIARFGEKVASGDRELPSRFRRPLDRINNTMQVNPLPYAQGLLQVGSLLCLAKAELKHRLV